MNKKINYILLNICRSIIKFFCFWGIFNTVNILFLRFTEQFNEEKREGWSLVILIFVMVSISWVFYYFNKRVGSHFLETYACSGFVRINTPIRALKSLDFFSDAVVCCILSLISPFVFQYADIERLFFENTNMDPMIQKLSIGLFISLAFFFVQWFTIFDVRKKWIRTQEISSKNEIFVIVAYLCFITVMYAVGFYIAMAYVPGISVYIFLFKELFWEILLAIIIILLLVYFNRIYKRKNFIADLKRAVAEFNYELSKIKKPYLSVFGRMHGASFTITVHEKTYQCKLLSGKRKSVPIIFSDQGFLLFRRIIRIGKSELFSVYSKQSYSFQSDTKKCLIITCIPAQCYFKDSSGYMRKIDTGEKIGDYTVYSPRGFLGALERDCLDR